MRNAQSKVKRDMECRIKRWQGKFQAIAILGGLSLAWGGVTHPAQAQVVQNQPMFTDVTLGPRFIPDPTRVRGLSGGEVYAEEVAGRLKTETGSCVGFVNEKPDHEVRLTDFFQYLNMQVFSRGDTILLVRGPGGTWCSDDRTTAGPSIAGQWLPGLYEIWIGSIDGNEFSPYQLEFSEAR